MKHGKVDLKTKFVFPLKSFIMHVTIFKKNIKFWWKYVLSNIHILH